MSRGLLTKLKSRKFAYPQEEFWGFFFMLSVFLVQEKEGQIMQSDSRRHLPICALTTVDVYRGDIQSSRPLAEMQFRLTHLEAEDGPCFEL